MAEGVALHGRARRLEVGDDVVDPGALGQEDVDAADFVHHRAQSLGLGREVDAELRDVHRVDRPAARVQADAGQPLLTRVPVHVVTRGCRGEPPTGAAHHLVHDQHAWVGAVLGEHVLGEARRLVRRRQGAEALPDRDDVVVDGLGETDDGELGALRAQVRRQVGRRGVGVVTADGVEDVHAVVLQARCRHGECGLVGPDQATLAAVGVVGQLDPAVADRAAAEGVEPARRPPSPRGRSRHGCR